MSNSQRLTIAFKGLSVGRHFFEFELDDKFFTQLEASEIQKGKLQVDVELNKLNNLLELDIDITGEVAVECDRCLDEFYLPVDYQGKLLVSFSEHVPDEDEYDENEEAEVDTMVLHPSDDMLDLTQYCYESICLSLPMQRVHPDDAEGNSTCNKEMLERLKQLLKEV